MAEYKLVDAEKLDADLTAVADAIREKTGSTQQLAFPEGFASAVAGITTQPESNPFDLRINGSLSEYSSDVPTKVSTYSFSDCANLTRVELPNVKNVETYGFARCPLLAEVSLPAAVDLALNAFLSCTALQKVDFPSMASIKGSAFSKCSMLDTVILRSENVCSLVNANAFNATPIASGTGYIYVPSALVNSYKVATNWSTYADRIRAIEDYSDITGGAAV